MNALKPRTPESYIIDLLRLINKYNLVVFVLTVYTEIHKVTTWVRFRCRFRVSYYTLKKCWVVSTQIWVKYGQTQMLC